MSGTPAEFELAIAKWVEKTQANLDNLVRGIVLELFRRIVMRSPVGNPELWAANKEQVAINAAAGEFNAELRTNPANLTRAGSLRAGLKQRKVKLRAGRNYVGGRFRSAWRISVGSPGDTYIGMAQLDPDGQPTIVKGKLALASAVAGVPIWIANALPYGQRLEFESWSSQSPAGFVRVSMAEIEEIVRGVVQRLESRGSNDDF